MLTLACLWLAASTVVAQEASPPPDLYTLHVYANVIQVPTLVMDGNDTPIPALKGRQFDITLDSGPVFHPTSVRLEGEDPIELAILLDTSGDENILLRKLPDALAGLVPRALHANDRITFYALDCKLIRSAHAIPPAAEPLRQALNSVLEAPNLHGEKPHSRCRKTLHLWDAVAKIDSDLAAVAGRRVLLAVTSGQDGQSAVTMKDLLHRTAGSGVAVFGLRDPDDPLAANGPGAIARRTPANHFSNFGNEQEDLLDTLCRSNGGVILNGEGWRLGQTLREFIALLRSRYIVEFPRPDNSTSGFHAIDIEVAGRAAQVRATGASAPLPDPALQNDPNTVPSTPSPALMGTRRPLPPKS